jgi:hypothetical protein
VAEKDIKDKISARLAKASRKKVRVHFTSLETLLLSNSILTLKKNDEAVSVDKVFPSSLLTANVLPGALLTNVSSFS